MAYGAAFHVFPRRRHIFSAEGRMGVGTVEDLRAMIEADGDCKLPAESYEFYITANSAAWEKKPALVGTGHCVPLVQEAAGAPVTSMWLKGPKVKGNSKIPEGTVIATFSKADKYENAATGNHAALFLSVSEKGILVVDQWKAKDPAKPSRRILKFKGGSGSASNDGDQFSVVVTKKVITAASKQGTGWFSKVT